MGVRDFVGVLTAVTDLRVSASALGKLPLLRLLWLRARTGLGTRLGAGLPGRLLPACW